MNHWISSRLIIYVGLIVLLFSTGCGTAPTPKPPPSPSFVGRLIVLSGDNVYELAGDSAMKMANDLKIAGPRAYPVTISPDKRKLIYSIEAGSMTRLRNLDTGEDTLLFPQSSDYISWSADSDMISYVSNGVLSVYSFFTGNSTQVCTEPSATYRPKSGGGETTFTGYIDSGDWIGSDYLVFNRHKGNMPAEITSGAEIGADTTTIAKVGTTITLVDLSRQFFIRDISTLGTQILLERQGEWYLASSFGDSGSINERHILLSSDAYVATTEVRFMPIGADLYYLDRKNRIHFINSDTLEDNLGPKLPDNWRDWIWLGDPKDNVFAVVEPAAISVVDLDTGGRMAIIEGQLFKDIQCGYTHSRILVWLSS